MEEVKDVAVEEIESTAKKPAKKLSQDKVLNRLCTVVTILFVIAWVAFTIISKLNK